MDEHGIPNTQERTWLRHSRLRYGYTQPQRITTPKGTHIAADVGEDIVIFTEHTHALCEAKQRASRGLAFQYVLNIGDGLVVVNAWQWKRYLWMAVEENIIYIAQPRHRTQQRRSRSN